MKITMSTATRQAHEKEEKYDADRTWEQKRWDILMMLTYGIAANILVYRKDRLARFNLAEKLFTEVCRIIDETPDGEISR